MPIPTEVATLLYQALLGSTPKYLSAKTATIGAATQTTGSGLNDATSGGTYTPVVDHVIQVKLSVAAAQDKIKYNVDGGAFGNEQLIVAGNPLALTDGVTITFVAQTAHTLNDVWTITCKAGVAVTATELAKIHAISVGNTAELVIYNGTSSSGDVLYDGLTANWTAGQLYQLGFLASTGSLYIVLYAGVAYPKLIVGYN
jgi:hypothetical protein